MKIIERKIIIVKILFISLCILFINFNANVLSEHFKYKTTLCKIEGENSLAVKDEEGMQIKSIRNY